MEQTERKVFKKVYSQVFLELDQGHFVTVAPDGRTEGRKSIVVAVNHPVGDDLISILVRNYFVKYVDITREARLGSCEEALEDVDCDAILLHTCPLGSRSCGKGFRIAHNLEYKPVPIIGVCDHAELSYGEARDAGMYHLIYESEINDDGTHELQREHILEIIAAVMRSPKVLIISDWDHYSLHGSLCLDLKENGITPIIYPFDVLRDKDDPPADVQLKDMFGWYPECNVVLCNQIEEIPRFRQLYPEKIFIPLWFPEKESRRDLSEESHRVSSSRGNSKFIKFMEMLLKPKVLFIPEGKHHKRTYDQLCRYLQIYGIMPIIPAYDELNAKKGASPEELLPKMLARYPECNVVLCNQNMDPQHLRSSFPGITIIGISFSEDDSRNAKGPTIEIPDFLFESEFEVVRPVAKALGLLTGGLKH